MLASTLNNYTKAIEKLSMQIVSEDKTTLDEKENLANWLKTQI